MNTALHSGVAAFLLLAGCGTPFAAQRPADTGIRLCSNVIRTSLPRSAPGGRAQTPQQAETEIRACFGALKTALSSGKNEALLREMSPATLDLFKAAREFGLDPDTTDPERLSQMEVLLGLQARWVLGIAALKSKSAGDLFLWGVQNGTVPVGGLAALDLCAVKADGDQATAAGASGLTVFTNVLFSFSRHDGKWGLDFDRILLANEPELAALRAERKLGKTEMAVMALEGLYKQAIPSLRELLLPSGVRQKLAALKEAKPGQAYDSVLAELGAGRQRDAEAMVEVLVGIHTNDQRLAFVQAVCSRSRFSRRAANGQFQRILELDPRTVEGKCARYMLDLDAGKSVDEGFKGLHLLAEESPDNPLIHWMIGVACRNYYTRTHKTDRSLDGVRAYQRVLELFPVGPVMVHQTFANVLSEGLDRYEEALPHHKKAVEMEPKGWCYEGLAGTLKALNRYDEANEAYEKAVALDPDSVENWFCWGNCLRKQRKWDESIAKMKKVLEIDPGYYGAIHNWGAALHSQGKLREALEKYEETIRINPMSANVYDDAAAALTALGEPDKAQEFLQRKARALGNPP